MKHASSLSWCRMLGLRRPKVLDDAVEGPEAHGLRDEENVQMPVPTKFPSGRSVGRQQAISPMFISAILGY